MSAEDARYRSATNLIVGEGTTNRSGTGLRGQPRQLAGEVAGSVSRASEQGQDRWVPSCLIVPRKIIFGAHISWFGTTV